MGWWSPAIMGGDSPLDAYGDIWGVCGVKYDGDHHERLSREVLDKNAKKLEEWALKNEKDPVALHALGVTLMERGARMSRWLKARIIQAAKNDEWAKKGGSDSERGRKIQAFIEKVKAYFGGKPKDCSDEEGLMSRGGGTSLFENLEKAVAGGKLGLINTGPGR